MELLSKKLKQLHDCGDVGSVLEGWAEQAEVLEKQNTALAAQNAKLLELVESARSDYISEHDDGVTDCVTPYDLYNLTPAACLAQVQIPQNADDAAAMALLGTNWLQQNAPERLTEYMNQVRAEAVIEAAKCCAESKMVCVDSHRDRYESVRICEVDELNQYAERILKGGAS